MHGGAAPQVQAAALKRLEELRDPAIQYYAWLLEQRDFPSAGLGAANSVMDRTDGKPTEKVEMEVTGEIALIAPRLQEARRRLADRG